MKDSNRQTTVGPFPTFKRLFRWLFSWRTIRRCLFVFISLVTLLALFYAEENWRGRRAWNKYRQGLEARGEQLDYRAFIPKPVPDEQNFAATPFVQSWFVRENLPDNQRWSAKDNYARASSMVQGPKSRTDRQFVDLVAWKMAFDAVRSGQTNSHQEFRSDKLDLESRARAAPGVFEGLKGDEASLEELRAASRRPSSRYPIVYDLENPWGILIPHLASIKAAVLRLKLRACAELATGQGENALEDVKLMLYLADSLKEEPFLISYLVRIECPQIAIQPIWEGLAEHRWSDAQLQELQTRLQQYNFVGDMKRPLDGERAAGILTADLLYRRKYRPSELGLSDQPDPTGGDLVDFVSQLVPRGWYHQEQLNYCRLYENQLRGTFDAAKRKVFPVQIATRAHELEREIAGGRLGKTLNAVLHHQLLAAMLLPALDKIPLKAATVQTAADQAALACALERYRLANGQYPEKLDMLAPHFLEKIPNDVISGEPLKYRRTDDGQFILYSLGWNEKDDGGRIVPTTGPSPAVDLTQGDWVWHSALPD